MSFCKLLVHRREAKANVKNRHFDGNMHLLHVRSCTYCVPIFTETVHLIRLTNLKALFARRENGAFLRTLFGGN